MESKLSFLRWFAELQIYLGNIISKTMQNAANSINPIVAFLGAIFLIPLGIKIMFKILKNL